MGNKEDCKICRNNKNNIIHIVKEMNQGLKDEFEYLECNNCGCLQLINIPTDFSKYYPDNYYSFAEPKYSVWKKIRTKLRGSYFFGKLNPVCKLSFMELPKKDFFDWCKKTNVGFSSKILDIGCGNGNRLRLMFEAGFSNLFGVDPYIKNDINYENKVKIYKKEIFDVSDDNFDFIMLNHSFEHMNCSEDVLKKIYQILKPNAYVLIRIPIASSFAWNHYNINWVQIDAPRHLFLHTLKSMEILAERTGFITNDIVYDSTEFQFLGSEGYIRGIPLLNRKNKSLFSKKDRKKYKEKAKELNEECYGDQACFYLQKK